MVPTLAAAPSYPALARQARVEGMVVVFLDVEADGMPSDARVENALPLLHGAAREAARSWRFAPGAAGRSSVIVFDFVLGDRDP